MHAAVYAEKHLTSKDNLELYYRDYGDRAWTATPVLCLPGLTRNSADFHDVALHLAGKGRRVLCPDLRGRGKSAHDPDYKNYSPQVELQDVLDLMAAAGAPHTIVIGTSRGGVLAMLLAAARPTALTGVVLNDIGPEIEPAGLARVVDYVNMTEVPATWEEAADRIRTLEEEQFPGLSDEVWLKQARQRLREVNGKPALGFDPALGRATREAAQQGGAGTSGMWPVFEGLMEIPTLVIRGANSDILSAATVEKMKAVKPDLQTAEIPERGHAPFLNEPASLAALDSFIDRLA